MPSYGTRELFRVSGLGKGTNMRQNGTQALGQCYSDWHGDYELEWCPGCNLHNQTITILTERQRVAAESGGFVETQERVKEIDTLLNMDTDNFPVSLICYRGEKAIPILNVRMDSIRVKESIIPGYVNVEYEGYGNAVTGTVPMVDYYTTESE